MALDVSSSFTKIQSSGSTVQVTYANSSRLSVGSITPTTSQSVSMTASHAISASYAPGGGALGSGIPIGSMVVFPGNSNIDENWLACNNQLVSTTSYSELKSALDSQWVATSRTATECNAISAYGGDICRLGDQRTFLQVSGNFKSASIYDVVTNTSTYVTCSRSYTDVYIWSKKYNPYVSTKITGDGFVFYNTSTTWLEYHDVAGNFVSGGFSAILPHHNSILPYSIYTTGYNATASYFISNGTASLLNLSAGGWPPIACAGTTGVYWFDTIFDRVKKGTYSTGSGLWTTSSIGIDSVPVTLINNSSGEVYFVGDRFVSVLEGPRSGSTWSFTRQLHSSSLTIDDDNLLIFTNPEGGQIYQLNLTSSAYTLVSNTGSSTTSPSGTFSNVTQLVSGGFFNTSDGFYAVPGMYTPQSIGLGYTVSYTTKYSAKLFNSQSIAISYPFVILSNGDLYGLGGGNSYGIFCQGYTSSAVSQSVLIDTNVAEVSSDGLYNVIYRKNDGTLWGAGYNGYGVLATGTVSTVSQSIQIASNVRTYSIVQNSSQASLYYITNTNDLYGSGLNMQGQLGLGNTTNQLTASLIASNVQKVFPRMSGSTWTTHFLKNDGTLYGAGYNDQSQVIYSASPPTMISASVLVTGSVASGSVYTTGSVTYFVSNAGTLFGYGRSNEGQCAIASATSTIRQISTGIVSSSVVTNGYTTYFKSTTLNRLYGIGYNNNGQIGNGTTTNVTTAYLIAPNVNRFSYTFYQLAPHFSSSLYFITTGSSGKLYGCGSNSFGQLGPTVSGTSMSLSPTLIDNAVYDMSASNYQYDLSIAYSSASNQMVFLYQGKHIFNATSSQFLYDIHGSVPKILVLETNGSFEYYGSSSYVGYDLINYTSSNEGSASARIAASSVSDFSFSYPNLPKIETIYTDQSYYYYAHSANRLFLPNQIILSGSTYSIALQYTSIPIVTYTSSIGTIAISIDSGSRYYIVPTSSSVYPYYGFYHNNINLYYYRVKLLIDGWDGFIPVVTPPANSVFKNLKYYIRAR